jgi:hypothetical protein
MKFPPTVARYAVAGLGEAQLLQMEQSLAARLPAGLREFLKLSDGLSFGGGLLIYGSADLKERNDTWEVNEYAPGYLAIGDDGGGSVFLMRVKDDEDPAIYAVGSGVMDPEFAEKVSESLYAWVSAGLVVKGQS